MPDWQLPADLSPAALVLIVANRGKHTGRGREVVLGQTGPAGQPQARLAARGRRRPEAADAHAEGGTGFFGPNGPG